MKFPESILSNCDHTSASDSRNEYGGGDEEFALLRVQNSRCSAVVALQGAQLLEFVPVEGEAMLWLSPRAQFVRGRAVRGGIPLCLPWFGPHASDPDKPQHGFARTSDWRLDSARALDAGTTRLSFVLDQFSSAHSPHFPFRFRATMTMTLGEEIEIELSVKNCDQVAMPLSWALHSYHPVSDLSAVRVAGLEGCEYLDSTCEGRREVQQGNLVFAAEVDRIYVDVPDRQRIEGHPAVEIVSENCNSAILWNPGLELAARMEDVGPGGHAGFICLEKGNAADNRLSLAADETHTATVRIRSSRN